MSVETNYGSKEKSVDAARENLARVLMGGVDSLTQSSLDKSEVTEPALHSVVLEVDSGYNMTDEIARVSEYVYNLRRNSSSS